jgi:sugar phosphate permease
MSQSIVFPTLVAIVGSWFSTKHRGLITGSWGASANVGNLIGIHLSTTIFNLTDRRWGELMNAICLLFMFNSLIAYVLLKPCPEQDGFIINLDDEI